MDQQKQPKGLYLLFFTELWERFGFYALQTIFILYLVHGLKYSDTRADLMYGSFGSLLYLMPMVGGYIADTYLGFQKAIIIGGLLFVVGYVFTSLPGDQTFFIGLSIIIIAHGLFKPNVSSLLGELYQDNDSRREGGFTIFYMGINIGSLIPPLFLGSLVAYFGWHLGFLTATVGMVIGMITFFTARSCLNGVGLYPRSHQVGANENALIKNPLTWRFKVLFSVGLISLAVFLYFAMQFPIYTNVIVVAGMIASLFTVVYFLLREEKHQRNRMLASLLLIIISVGFWVMYNQTFSSLMLFADRNMGVEFLGFTINAEFTQSFNPFFIIVLSPLLSKMWLKLGKKHNPSIAIKFATGVFLMAVSFIVLAFGAYHSINYGVISPWWLVLCYFLQTLSELLISPIGLAMITMLAPKHLVGMMMGVWFLAQSASFSIGGSLATLSAVPKMATLTTALAIYAHAFWIYGVITLVMAAISFACVPYLHRLMVDDR